MVKFNSTESICWCLEGTMFWSTLIVQCESAGLCGSLYFLVVFAFLVTLVLISSSSSSSSSSSTSFCFLAIRTFLLLFL